MASKCLQRDFSFSSGLVLSVLVVLAFLVQLALPRPHHNRHHHGNSIDDDLDAPRVVRLNAETSRLIYEHQLRVNRLAACTPKPRVIPVYKLYPDPSKFYSPHCTVLHRCGGDSACCGSANKVCVVKTEERVRLHFFSWAVGRVGERQSQKVEELTFMNHTSCECVNIESVSDTEGVTTIMS